MNVTILASGSKHNAMVVEMAGQLVMVDCGLGYRDTVARMMAAGLDPESLSAILVTHSHGDHTDGLLPLTKKVDVPVYMSAGCADALKKLPRRTLSFQPGQSFKIGKLIVGTFEVPHTAVEPVGFTLTAGGERFAMATDLGHITPVVRSSLLGADFLAIESNHDEDAVRAGDDHPSLKMRNLGPNGHLANNDVAEFIKHGLPGTSELMLLHISLRNNRAELARLVAERAIEGKVPVRVALENGGIEK